MAMLTIFFFLMAELVALCGAGKVEHTFVVSMVHLCKETLVTVVNGQLPGPMIEVEEGDSLAIHIVNKSPYGLTIHWHGVKQRLNCWADGVGMITQCPIQPNTNFTYRFDVAGHEGTLWWHAPVYSLRATVHGALVIRPRSPSSYPFPKPDGEIPIIIGDWWEIDLEKLDRMVNRGDNRVWPSAATINGNLGDLYNHSGTTMEDNYVLDVEHGNTYLLRITNAALFNEYYLKMPDQNDTTTSFYFHGNLTSLPHPRLPPLMTHVDESLFIALSIGSLHCKPGHGPSCSPSLWVASDSYLVATMNNISFQLPQTTPLLVAHYYKSMESVQELPDRPVMMYNFTGQVPLQPAESRETVVKRFRYNTVVDVVFQSTGVRDSGSNPMHLHGHDMFVLAQGFGNYDSASDMKRYNLVDPPLRNTIIVPRLGWSAIRFVTKNPGVWFMHCHFGYHQSSGMAAAFVVEDGPTLNTSLPPLPIDLPACGQHNTAVE
ncbi:unnamed protein product [Alopecurus aequalis]